MFYDHKKIGKKLNLFFFYFSGIPIWLSEGVFIYNKIKKIIKKYNIKNKYKEVITPNLGNYSLYKRSGHLNKYKKNIFQIFFKKKIYLKPMNCPYHCIIYKNLNNVSYKDMPIKFFEFGQVYRNEKSGELNGLFRTRSFTQDDGHIFCSNIFQIKKEIKKIISFILFFLKKFKLKKFFLRLSLKDEKKKKYIGSKKKWAKSEKILLEIIKKIKKKYKIKLEIKKGEAAFYGPKIDFIIQDNLKRNWQLSTIQLDFNTPKKFNLKFFNKKNKKKYPILIHRAFLGSLERFIGILLEHTKGFLPFFLLKFQIVILPININNLLFCRKILYFLKKKKIKSFIDKSKLNFNKKIKKYKIKKIPIIYIIGEKEIKNKKIFIINNKKNKKKILKVKKAFKYTCKYIKKFKI